MTGLTRCRTQTSLSLPFDPSTRSGLASSGRTAAWYVPWYLCFVFALCERKHETQKEDTVPLRKNTAEPPRTSCHLGHPLCKRRDIFRMQHGMNLDDIDVRRSGECERNGRDDQVGRRDSRGAQIANRKHFETTEP